jgi:uncharacterized protein YecE (DUF72 family)
MMQSASDQTHCPPRSKCLSRLFITHEKRLCRTKKLVEEFFSIEKILGSKLSCFLLQFPPSSRYPPSRLKSLIEKLDPAYRNAIEFRHKSWWRKSVYRQIAERDLISCSISAPRLPDALIETSDVIYIRFHGPTRWYRHDYFTKELAGWARQIRESGAREPWIYFNNDREGFAIKNVKELTKQLGCADPLSSRA